MKLHKAGEVDSQSSFGDEVHVSMSSDIETQMLKTLRVTCVFVSEETTPRIHTETSRTCRLNSDMHDWLLIIILT